MGRIYPNPLISECIIEFLAIHPLRLNIQIIDITGRIIKTFEENCTLSGNHHVEWDGKDGSGNLVNKGIYYCILKSENGGEVLKLVKL